MHPQTQHQLLHRKEEQEAEVRLQRREEQAAEAKLQREAAIALGRQQLAEAERVRATMDAEQRQLLLKFSQFIWLGFGVLEGLIGLRILLKLVAANPDTPFAKLIYAVTNVFLWPFTGLTLTPAANGMVLEIPSIIAWFFYALVSILIQRLIWITFSRPRV
jgi:hypothetical protein